MLANMIPSPYIVQCGSVRLNIAELEVSTRLETGEWSVTMRSGRTYILSGDAASAFTALGVIPSVEALARSVASRQAHLAPLAVNG